MPINSRVYPPAGLTYHETLGHIAPDEFRDTLRSFYKETGPTLNVLWDARKANWDKAPANQILAAIREAMRLYHAEAGERKGGRTAVVVSTEAGYSIVTMAQILMETYTPWPPFEVEVFADMDEAKAWLSHRPPQEEQESPTHKRPSDAPPIVP